MKPLSPLSFVRGKLPTVTLVYGEDLQLIEEVREAVGGSVPAENLHRHTLEGIAKSKLSSNDNKGLFSADAPECFEITVDGKLSGTSERESKGGGGLDWLLAKAENTAPPDLLLIVLRQWERKQARTAWFKKLSAIGVCVQADRLMGVAGLEWIQRWAEAHHLSMTPDAARQLALQTQGNLFAAKQAVVKLTLIGETGPVTPEAVRRALADGAKYDVFDLTHAILDGKRQTALHIMRQLLILGIAPPILVWGLNQLIGQLMAAKTKGKVNAWGAQLQKISRLAAAADERKLSALLRQAAFVDRTIKGVAVGDFPTALTQLVVQMTSLRDDGGARIPTFRE